jgi:hypothetical protein
MNSWFSLLNMERQFLCTSQLFTSGSQCHPKVQVDRKRKDFARPDMAILQELFPQINVPDLKKK